MTAASVALEGWQRPDQGVLFVVTGPSGVGKSTLIRSAMARINGLHFSCSATTRAPRRGEKDGRDYHFLDRERFDARVEAGEFLEHATVYDRSYGTLRAPTLAALERGDSLILDIDIQGAAQLRESMPESVSIFIVPPSLAALERRLRARATDSEEIILGRMRQVAQQIEGCGDFDYLVLNDVLSTGKTSFEAVLLAEMSRRARRDRWVRDLTAEVAGSGHGSHGD